MNSPRCLIGSSRSFAEKNKGDACLVDNVTVQWQDKSGNRINSGGFGEYLYLKQLFYINRLSNNNRLKSLSHL